MISSKTVQQVKDVVQIEDVIGEFVQLKRAGQSLKGLCPFHNEKTPSFSVSPSKNVFKCFGCDVKGDAITFLMEHERLSFEETIRWLAKRYNIEIEEKKLTPEELRQQNERDSLYLVNEFAAEYYQKQLFETAKGKSIALNYFKERGFREATIQKFDLGYSPEQWDAFTKYALSKHYQLDYLKKLGLTNTNGKDFFRGRVIFPIHGLSGKVIAFAGRILKKDVKAPKYINSPETEIYHKSKVLYGMHFAKGPVRKADECILVEGYTDVISLHQSGIENVVASSGTSLTVDQIRLIKRNTPNVKLLYDGDTAGIKAALRGVDLLLEQDMNVKVVILPEGEDPDSYLKQAGATAFKEYLHNQAKDFIFFKTQLILQESENDPVKKAKGVQDIVTSISKIPDPLKRSFYIKDCARLLDIQEQTLIEESNKLVRQEIHKTRKREAREERKASATPPQETATEAPSKRVSTNNAEKELARVLVCFGGEIMDEEEQITVAGFLLKELEDVIDQFDTPLYSKIANECLNLLLDKKQINHSFFLQHQDQAIRDFAFAHIESEFKLSENWEKKHDIILQTQPQPEENFRRDALTVLKAIQIDKIKFLKRIVAEKIQDYFKQGDYENANKYLEIANKYNEIQKNIS